MANLNTMNDPLLNWSDLWPAHGQVPAEGWTEQVQPGVHLLFDETGEEGQHWAALFAGHAQPGRGQVQCNGLCSHRDRAAYQAQVYWQKPPGNMYSQKILAQDWVRSVALSWPQWDEVQWRLHCEGFDLTQHLNKPLWHLSTGSLRKLGIAAALASQATLTVIEEPVAALDVRSIEYLCETLDSLTETLAANPSLPPRWVLVVHWELLHGVTWNEVLSPPALASADTLRSADWS